MINTWEIHKDSMEQTRAYLFDIFADYKLRAGYYIDKVWLILAYNKAGLLIQKNFDSVLEQMFEEGLLEHKEGKGDTLFLTQMGEDSLMNYLEGKNNTMLNNNSGINISVNPIITQTNSQTITSENTQTAVMTLNMEQVFQENGLNKEVIDEIKEIINSTISKEAKKDSIIGKLKDLPFSVISNILATLIINTL